MKAQQTQQALWTGGPILLIEDEPSVIAFLRAALERKGYAVVNASSGWIQKNRPELKTRIILISGDTANSDTQAFLAKSGTPCIEKPFRVQQLISMVEKTFGKP